MESRIARAAFIGAVASLAVAPLLHGALQSGAYLFWAAIGVLISSHRGFTLLSVTLNA